MTITIRLRLRWWVKPAMWAAIGYWLVRRALAGRHPSDDEIDRVATWIGQRGVRFETV